MLRAQLQARKQQVVRDTIFEAAIDLFTARGFDETTIEDIAKAAGVSRRTFFHYYAAKDDLLAQNVTSFGAALIASIDAFPKTASLLEVVRETILSVGTLSVESPRTRQIVEISQRSIAARKAHASRLLEIEDSVAAAFARRINKSSTYAIKPRLLAHLTISILNISVLAWFTGEHAEYSKAVKESFSTLYRIMGEVPVDATPAIVLRARAK